MVNVYFSQIAALRKSGEQDYRLRTRTFSSMEGCSTANGAKCSHCPNNAFNTEEELQKLRDMLNRVGKIDNRFQSEAPLDAVTRGIFFFQLTAQAELRGELRIKLHAYHPSSQLV